MYSDRVWEKIREKDLHSPKEDQKRTEDLHSYESFNTEDILMWS